MNSFLQTVFTTATVLAGTSGQRWVTVWRDDFNGPQGSQPSQADWIFDTGTSYPGGPETWGTGEVETYTTNIENLRVGGGTLQITPRRDSRGRWTSGRIETRRTDFRPVPGGILAIEGRIRMPDVTGDRAIGYWPAFWALGAPFRGNYQNWPRIGEFDIMESVNGLNFVKGVLHCGVENGGPCNEKVGLGLERSCPGASCESAFHVYRIEWDDNVQELRWFVDGQNYYRVTRSQIGDSTWNDITNHGYFILLNVAMGGGYPNDKYKQTTPIAITEPGHSMLVDYVAVYSYQ